MAAAAHVGGQLVVERGSGRFAPGDLATTALAPSPGSTPGTAVQGLAAAEASPDPGQIRAAFAVAARSLGWVAIKVAGGAIL